MKKSQWGRWKFQTKCALSHSREPSSKPFNLSYCVGLVFFTALAGGLSYCSLSHLFLLCCLLYPYSPGHHHIHMLHTLFPFSILQHTGLQLCSSTQLPPCCGYPPCSLEFPHDGSCGRISTRRHQNVVHIYRTSKIQSYQESNKSFILHGTGRIVGQPCWNHMTRLILLTFSRYFFFNTFTCGFN